jgi:hypothetical protein
MDAGSAFGRGHCRASLMTRDGHMRLPGLALVVLLATTSLACGQDEPEGTGRSQAAVRSHASGAKVRRTRQIVAWSALRRRYRIPAVDTGRACPVSRSHARLSDFTHLLGGGPLYPSIARHGLLRPVPVSKTIFANVASPALYVDKTLWVAPPSFVGRALVRLARLDGQRGPAGFYIPSRTARVRRPSGELHLVSSAGGRSQSGWRNWPTSTFVSRSGCFGFRVDTEHSSQEIVFRVRTRR